MIKAVIFDMDGTMFDTEPLWEKAFLKTGKELGYPVTKEIHAKTIGISIKLSERIMKEELGEDFPFQTFSTEYINNMRKILKKEGPPLKKGLLELLKYLKENRYKIAIASSSRLDLIKQNLNQTKIDEKQFQGIISGEDFTKGKPDPDIFIRTCEMLEVETKDALVIEDSNNGIKAANKAGCISVLIPDMDIVKEKAKYQFDSLLGIIDLLKKENTK